MRQDLWLERTLRRHAFVIYACHICSRHYYAISAFAEHLLAQHAISEPRLLRFVGRDSDDDIVKWLNDPAPTPQDPSASL